MNRFSRYGLVGVLTFLAIGLSYNMFIDFLNAKREAEGENTHIEAVTKWMLAILYGFEINPIGRLWSLNDEASGNSWRLYYTLTYPFDDADFLDRPDGGQPWRSESFREWDDSVHWLFCLKKDIDAPRDERYTHLMAIAGEGTAFEFMQQEGLDELRRVAPDAILLTEVINSKVPWMQKGDLDLDNMPHEINSHNELGIGSAHGYNQFGIGFADGSVWVLKSSVPFSQLEKFLTVERARKHDRQKILGKYVVEVEVVSPVDSTDEASEK
jgi:hypothetical protein